MAGRRNYDDPCGVARALDLVGERWALLVVRELLLGPKRFSDLSRGLPGMSQNVLSQRLRELEQAGIVRRVRLGPPASTGGYELTELGAGLDQVLLALARWGSGLPLESAADLSVDALALALRTTFDPDAADGLRAVLALRIGDDLLRAEIDGGSRFQISRGSAPDADATLTAGATTLRSLVFGGLPLTAALASGDARVTGDLDVSARFLRCFPRPAIAAHG
ncbi:DNA-binding HxlR family transcriptional regulator [Streptacidiphilus sp. MAP12-20]|uniref:winged helix-turn-helix transcriptional regulator n=1 Tax=Streptacidiphilus sp. MAP12-20 TaxID=3156299 RepID=UPI00351753BC